MRETSMTNFLYGLKIGETVEFKGPLGGFEYHRNMYREIGLVAGGTGISPMMQVNTYFVEYSHFFLRLFDQ
jgi:cytochrome-b5 reductase